ncbi:esterase-like activity of phytase family protein [Acuticoccus mangrovi]|uniref:Esterase-like activity of phytase family protein n=1 Tax=Acuticoccus mangrovi TaxID=2796142 RepID=A0A934MD73_9HYPH|nr:esterase-like activity of phytase family protein [Acuticoccus mangrovi]MBJ3776037.1 esterase-like activity of phytase family protein [Acuticoccus mangrovi]
MGGLVLNGPHGFGGFSGLLTEGERFLAVSDTGFWLTGRMLLDGGRLTGVADTDIVRRVDLAGRPITDKETGDAEALTRHGDGILAAQEHSGDLLLYPADGLAIRPGPPRRLPAASALRLGARSNGLEALATLPDGTVLIFLEGKAKTGPSIPAFRDPGVPFRVPRHGDWSITGADALPGGDVLIVERRYGGGLDVGLRVRRLGADAVRAGRDVDGPVLLDADFSAEIDNMEAISAEVVDGEILLTLMSDDNLSFLQRTLMLRFRVSDPRPRPKPLVRAGENRVHVGMPKDAG